MALVALSLLLAGVATYTALDASQKQAMEAREFAGAIQEQRVRTLREICQGQNARNRTAREYLRGLPRTATREQRERFASSAANAIVGPIRDCDALVARQAPPR